MADNITGLQTKPMTDFEKAQALIKSKQQTPEQVKSAEEAAYSQRVAASKPVYQLDIAGQKYNPFTGAKEEKITSMAPAASPIQPTTGLTTGATPAQIAKPIVSTPAPITAGQSTTTTSTKSKGLFGIDTDWYSKLNPSQQDSANKALMAAGFNLMQTGGTTYRTPISNAALFGQAGTVGLKTYEADQAAKARAASEAAKLKFDQEYKTAKLGLTGRGRSGGTSGVDYKKVAAYVTKESDKAFKIGDKNAKAQFDKAQPGQIITDPTTGIQHTKDKNGVHQVIHPDLGIPLDQGAYQSNLQTKGINELYPELGGTGWGSKTFAAGRNIPQPYQTMHNGVKGMYDPSTKMFTPL